MFKSKTAAYIYALIDPRTNAVRYIGKTHNVLGRFRGHCKGKGPTYSAKWIRQLAAEGLRPIVEVVEVVNSGVQADWEAAERQWIANFKLMGFKLTNLTEGGDSGWHLSEESKDKIRQSRLGTKCPESTKLAVASANRNRSPEWKAWKAESARNISHETREKMRTAARNASPEKRAKISATVKRRWQEGVLKPHSKESYEQMASKARGKKRTPEQRDRMRAASAVRAANPEWRKAHSLKLIGRKLKPESIMKREATRKAKWLARKAAQA